MSPVPIDIPEAGQALPAFPPLHAALTPFVAQAPRAARSTVAGFCAPGNPAGELGVGALLRFKSMMALEGQSVHLARLCYDRLYAYERIAAAHASSDEGLRDLALELFQVYHRCDGAGRPAP